MLFRWLVSAGTDPLTCDFTGLHEAARFRLPWVVRLLLPGGPGVPRPGVPRRGEGLGARARRL